MYDSELMMGITLFLLATGCQLLLPSLAIPGLPFLPNWLTLDKEAYLTEVSHIAVQLLKLGATASDKQSTEFSG